MVRSEEGMGGMSRKLHRLYVMMSVCLSICCLAVTKYEGV